MEYFRNVPTVHEVFINEYSFKMLTVCFERISLLQKERFNL